MLSEKILEAARKAILADHNPYTKDGLSAILTAALAELPGEPVAWQWRSRIKGGAWDAWESGRYGQEIPPFMEVEEGPLYAAPPAPAVVVKADGQKFQMGNIVRKKNGSWWEGRVVGFYSTEQTPDGYAVQIDKPNGPVQIYPGSALEDSK